MINEKPSKVLLVCVYDTGEAELTNEMVHARLNCCGAVRRILIFEKGHLTKCFVEMATEEEAAEVIRLLDGKKLF